MLTVALDSIGGRNAVDYSLRVVASRPGYRGQRVPQRRPGRDAELREDPVQVRADGPVGEEQLFTDLLVRQADRSQLGDLVLLPGQYGGGGVPAGARGVKLCCRAGGPGLGSELLEFSAALGVWDLVPTLRRVATLEGNVRPARGSDRALLDLERCAGKRVAVVDLERDDWDAPLLAKSFAASPPSTFGLERCSGPSPLA